MEPSTNDIVYDNRAPRESLLGNEDILDETDRRASAGYQHKSEIMRRKTLNKHVTKGPSVNESDFDVAGSMLRELNRSNADHAAALQALDEIEAQNDADNDDEPVVRMRTKQKTSSTPHMQADDDSSYAAPPPVRLVSKRQTAPPIVRKPSGEYEYHMPEQNQPSAVASSPPWFTSTPQSASTPPPPPRVTNTNMEPRGGRPGSFKRTGSDVGRSASARSNAVSLVGDDLADELGIGSREGTEGWANGRKVGQNHMSSLAILKLS